jgi:hypothetical protein
MVVNNLSGYFSDQRWLVAHNAWNTNQYPGNNQSKTITELLDYGVRGFALDIYGDTLEKLHLQHAHGNPATAIKWSIILAELDNWLKTHPFEIVTLFFESYLEGPKPDVVWNSPPALVALETSLLTIDCYRARRSVQENAIATQTLQSLIHVQDEDGKITGHRLFAFIEHEPDEGPQDHFPVMTKTFTENVYGNDSLNIKKWVNLREDSVYDNPLTFMNHFGDSPVASRWDGNDLHQLFKHVYSFVFNYYGRYPNFISLDEIVWGINMETGPIQIVKKLLNSMDLNVGTFAWQDKNKFDDVIFDIANEKITDLTVTTAQGQGITLIRAWREPNATNKIVAIKLVNVAWHGIVNLRFQNEDGTGSEWLTPFETDTDVDGGDITMATYDITNTLVGIACRVETGYGVTGFATATSPKLPLPPKKTFRSNR